MYKEIADIMGISINTVKNHNKTIFARMNVSSRTEACNILVNLNFDIGLKIIE
jgi:DNA-binding CsgD family transcriptional regulator